jgi:hypothetical protein
LYPRFILTKDIPTRKQTRYSRRLERLLFEIVEPVKIKYSIFLLKRELKIKTIIPHTITKARSVAEHDIRNFYVEALMEQSHMSYCNQNLIINMDATTVGACRTTQLANVHVIREAWDHLPVTVAKEDGLGIYVMVINQVKV